MISMIGFVLYGFVRDLWIGFGPLGGATATGEVLGFLSFSDWTFSWDALGVMMRLYGRGASYGFLSVCLM